MFVIGNLILALAKILHMLLNAYMWIIIARAILSWVNPDPYNAIVRFIYNITEPVLHAIRQRMPFSSVGGIDFAPMIVLLVIMFLDSFLVPSLSGLALRMGV